MCIFYLAVKIPRKTKQNKKMCHQTKNEGNSERHFTDIIMCCVCLRDSPWHSWKRLGERIAGQRNRKKMEPLISLKQASSFSDPNRWRMP